MSPQEFRQALVQYVLGNGFSGWTLIAKCSRGLIPVGLVLGEMRRKLVMLGPLVWFPWASPRNKLETTLTFVNGVRDEMIVMEWSAFDTRKSWEHICRYGVMRRVGTVYGMADEPMALFQSVARKR